MIIDLQPFDAQSPYLQGAMAVYQEYTGFLEASTRRFFADFLEISSFLGLVAVQNGEVIGMSFGMDSQTGDWWHDSVARHVGKQHPALNDAWVLTQLNVLSDHRNQGIGKMLHDAILTRQKRSNILLSTPVTNQAAQRFYLRHGWQFIHKGFSFIEGDEAFAIMHKKQVPYT